MQKIIEMIKKRIIAFLVGLLIALLGGTTTAYAINLHLDNKLANANLGETERQIRHLEALPIEGKAKRKQVFYYGRITEENLQTVLDNVEIGRDSCEVGGIYGYRNFILLCTDKKTLKLEIDLYED